jgi:hypothetical protein
MGCHFTILRSHPRNSASVSGDSSTAFTRRHYTIRAIPYQDPEIGGRTLKALHEARVKIVPRV